MSTNQQILDEGLRGVFQKHSAPKEHQPTDKQMPWIVSSMPWKSTNQQIPDKGLRGVSGVGSSKQVSLRIIQGRVILKGQEVQQSFLGRAGLSCHSHIDQLCAETPVWIILTA